MAERSKTWRRSGWHLMPEPRGNSFKKAFNPSLLTEETPQPVGLPKPGASAPSKPRTCFSKGTGPACSKET